MSRTPEPIRDEDLLAYLDEMLPASRAAVIEELLRNSPELRTKLSVLIQQRDQGSLTVGEIWRRHRLSCPTRSELGTFVLKVAPAETANYIQFHLNEIGCRICQANLNDLQNSLLQSGHDQQTRRQRYFESSAGLFRKSSPPH
ncbi:hypothetical protein [Planctomicrobium sp. SH527]|uniref:hypothetical protein n=1 Tax=Planctomicrobium sp. SH527 TaxID=3448123 RepID=UPI003F5B0693